MSQLESGDIIACRSCKKDLYSVVHPIPSHRLDKDNLKPVKEEIPLPGPGIAGNCHYCQTGFNGPSGKVEVIWRRKACY